MKKFKFKLDTPLKIKRMKEKIEIQKLAETITAKENEQKQLKTLKRIALDTREDLDEVLVDYSKAKDLYSFDIYMNSLKTLVERQKTVVNKAEELYNLTRLSYIEKRRDKEILEKLEEKSFQAYSKELDKEEQNLSDESGSLAFNRRERDVCNGYT